MKAGVPLFAHCPTMLRRCGSFDNTILADAAAKVIPAADAKARKLLCG